MRTNFKDADGEYISDRLGESALDVAKVLESARFEIESLEEEIYTLQERIGIMEDAESIRKYGRTGM